MDDSTVNGHDARAAETFSAGFAAGRAAALAEVDAAIGALAEHDEFETVTIWRVYTPCGWKAEAAPKIGGTLRLEGPTPTAAILAAAAALTGREGGAS